MAIEIKAGATAMNTAYQKKAFLLYFKNLEGNEKCKTIWECHTGMQRKGANGITWLNLTKNYFKSKAMPDFLYLF